MTNKHIEPSATQFIVFTDEATGSIEVSYESGTIWLTQKLMAELFDVEVTTINYHLQAIYESGELAEEATIGIFPIVRREGSRTVTRKVQHYNLDAIISVGYRVNSLRATQFRQWSTRVLSAFTLRGYVIDRRRMEQWTSLLDQVLSLDARELLDNAGKITKKLADRHATEEYNKFRPLQDKHFVSDFDRFNAEATRAINAGNEDTDESF